MKLAEAKNWKAVHLDGRTILKSDKVLYPGADWQKLISTVEVEPMKQSGHYRKV